MAGYETKDFYVISVKVGDGEWKVYPTIFKQEQDFIGSFFDLDKWAEGDENEYYFRRGECTYRITKVYRGYLK